MAGGGRVGARPPSPGDVVRFLSGGIGPGLGMGCRFGVGAPGSLSRTGSFGGEDTARMRGTLSCQRRL